MGYTLRIGEAVISWNEDCVLIDAEDVTLPESPAFGDPTDNTNARWPSYTAWANFTRAMRLEDVMFNQRNGGDGEFEWNGECRYPLIGEHPGAAPITKEHLAYVEHRIGEYRKSNPTHIAQYAPPKPGAVPLFGGSCPVYREEDLDPDPKYDGNLCRAEWLLFWMRWSLANCKHPVFVNS